MSKRPIVNPAIGQILMQNGQRFYNQKKPTQTRAEASDCYVTADGGIARESAYS